MTIVHFFLTIYDQKKITKAPKSKSIGEIVKEEYVIESIVVGYTIVMGYTVIEVDISGKQNLDINIKHKTRVIQNICCGAFVNGWVLNLANLSVTKSNFSKGNFP